MTVVREAAIPRGLHALLAPLLAVAVTLGLALLLLVGLSIPPAEALDFVLHQLRRSYVARTVAAGAAVLGVAGGVLGSFAVARGQSLLGDAVSHAALPGIYLVFMAWSLLGLAGRPVLGGVLPEPRSLVVVLAGALLTGLLATVVILWASRGTRLHQDAALAVTLSTFFGVGIVLRSLLQARPGAFGNRAGLEAFLYGSAATLTRADVTVLLAMAGSSVLIVVLLWKELKLLSFDPEYLSTLGFPVRVLDGLLTALIVVAVIVGLQMVGVILMSAMLVAPAVAARQWTDRLSWVVLLATVFGVVGGLVGVVASGSRAQVATGPVIALYVSALAVASVLVAPRRGVLSRLWRRRRQRRRFAIETLLVHLGHHSRGESESRLARELGWRPALLRRHIENARQAGWLRKQEGERVELSDAGRAHVTAVLAGLGAGPEAAGAAERS